jgi:hypothetical protein
MMKDLRPENDEIDTLRTATDKISLECYIEVHEECHKDDCECSCHS